MPLADGSSGWVAAGRAAEWLERVAGVSIEFVGRRGLDRRNSYRLEASGKYLSYTLRLDGGWLFFSVCPMDGGAAPECLFSIGDGKEGWAVCCRLIQALERAETRKLEPRPIRIGQSGCPDSWVIA
jgi:hypothetical protein